MAFSNPYSPVITQVSLPFSSPIPGGLTDNKQIQIQGVVQDTQAAERFSINLCEGEKVTPNCALHFNPRFNDGCIVRNAMEHGNWGSEERGGGMPIMRGQPFEIIIMCAPTGYFVAVNGRHFTEFKHRMPMSKVKYLNIEGAYFKINFIKYEGGNVPAPAPGGFGHHPEPGFSPGVAPPPYSAGGFARPGMGPPAGMMPPGAALGGDTIYNPAIPLKQRIPGRMRPDRMIFISATPSPDAKRFSINLEGAQRGNMNLHFDVRISYGSDYNVVVRNTCVNDEWGREERGVSHFPFFPNAAFDMIILAEANAFKVAVNNAHFIAYHHRQPLKKCEFLSITGDIRVTSVRFQ
ncbi:hypothetical protein ACOMHN_026518 [Nucella lapillus]